MVSAAPVPCDICSLGPLFEAESLANAVAMSVGSLAGLSLCGRCRMSVQAGAARRPEPPKPKPVAAPPAKPPRKRRTGPECSEDHDGPCHTWTCPRVKRIYAHLSAREKLQPIRCETCLLIRDARPEHLDFHATAIRLFIREGWSYDRALARLEGTDLDDERTTLLRLRAEAERFAKAAP